MTTTTNNNRRITRDEFAMACGERLIAIEIALENEKIVEAVKARDLELVKRLLRTEF